MSPSALPKSASEITPAWLNAVLPPSLLDGASVTAVATETLGVGEGFTSSLARLTLETDPPGAVPPLIAKFAPGHQSTRSLFLDAGAYEKEIRFYRDLAPRIALPTPACYLAQYDDEAGAFFLLFEDLARAARVGDQVAGATLAQARDVVDALVEFHAPWWNSEELLQQRWLLPASGFVAKIPGLLDNEVPAMRERWGERYPELIDLVDRALRLVPAFIDRYGEGPPPRPFTLVHGDVRLDNIFFPLDRPGRLAVIDWQGAALGQAANELAYWLILNLPVELRRRHEKELLRRYHEGLRRNGVRGFSFGSLQRGYRNGSVLLLALLPVFAGSVVDFSSERGTALAERMAERLDAAMRDINAKRLLQFLPWIIRGMDAWEAVRRAAARATRPFA